MRAGVLVERQQQRVEAGAPETFGGVVYDGLPLPGTEVRAVDGELQVRTPALAARFRDGTPLAGDDGWYRTGDLGAVDPATGRVSVHGRAGDVINTGGEKVWPDDVEAVLSRHPAVREVAVVGRDDPEWGQRVVAFVTPRAGAEVTQDQVREHCASRLAAYKKPKEVRVIDEFPLNSTGKIAKKELRAQLETQEGMP